MTGWALESPRRPSGLANEFAVGLKHHFDRFLQVGPGLFQRGPLGITIISVMIFAVQMVLSVYWLKRFQFGPAEWLWRSVAY